MTLYIGLMSGTSMDGIDAALMEVETHRLLGGLTLPYSPKLREQLLGFTAPTQVTPRALWQLHTLLGRQFAEAAITLLQQQGCDPATVAAIGSHGQTIAHDVTADVPYTIQLACPHTISELTGMTVVADFRTRDVVLGGKGAPFAPAYHQAIWQNYCEPLAVVNIGGIANITILHPNSAPLGYDVGPGNCLMDLWVYQQQGQAYDKDGVFAASGHIIPALLTALESDPYFALSYPKSICKSYFSSNWLKAVLKPDYAPEDVQATLLALTAHTIATAIKQHSTFIKCVVICGGGAHNSALLKQLQQMLPDRDVMSTRRLGVDPDFLEAMMFGWLAHQTLTATSVDLRSITGARRSAILGAVYPI